MTVKPCTLEPDQVALTAALDAFLTNADAAGNDPYLADKRALKTSLDEFVRVYTKVNAALAVGQRVLDWGCRHAPFSALARAQFGAGLELHGCDVCPKDDYAAFHASCGLRYVQLTHPWRLDYPDAY